MSTRKPRLTVGAMRTLGVFGSCVAAGWSSPAAAQLVPYTGFDRVRTPSVAGATNALSAESRWLTDAGRLGAIHTLDMESLAPGMTGSRLTVAPGVTMGVRGGYHPDSLTVVRGPSARYGSLRGFNSTAGGANHMSYASGDVFARPTVTFSFASPIQAFSLFVTGEGLNGLVSGSGMTLLRMGSPTTPAVFFGDLGNPYWPSTVQPDVRFGGFIDPTASFSTVTLQFKSYSSALAWHGSYSVDDVRWVLAPVPAPGGLAILGGAGVWASRRRRG